MQISVRKEDWSSHLARIQGPFFEYLMHTDSCSLQWNKLDWSPVAHLEKAVIWSRRSGVSLRSSFPSQQNFNLWISPPGSCPLLRSNAYAHKCLCACACTRTHTHTHLNSTCNNCKQQYAWKWRSIQILGECNHFFLLIYVLLSFFYSSGLFRNAIYPLIVPNICCQSSRWFFRFLVFTDQQSQSKKIFNTPSCVREEKQLVLIFGEAGFCECLGVRVWKSK